MIKCLLCSQSISLSYIQYCHFWSFCALLVSRTICPLLLWAGVSQDSPFAKVSCLCFFLLPPFFNPGNLVKRCCELPSMVLCRNEGQMLPELEEAPSHENNQGDQLSQLPPVYTSLVLRWQLLDKHSVKTLPRSKLARLDQPCKLF